jgi:hypothetical protein
MHSTVSGALVVEKETTHNDKTMKQQFPVYFLSAVLIGSKKFYYEMEKFCCAVIMSARKLQHYFEAHTIRVSTNQSLNDIFSNRDSCGRINKWTMEISEHIIDFKKRSAIKLQILVDFVAEWMEPGSITEGSILKSLWLVYCDGAWGTIGAGVATILISSSGIKLCYAARLQFNNEADKCNKT